jgi:DNA-binding CsgD family transcriptional regulator
MSRVKKFRTEHSLVWARARRPKEFVFVDKKTGTRRFQIKADKDGKMPVEQAVSLLAIHCVARQQAPGDFGVMVAAGEDLFAAIAARAAKLIQTCSGTKIPGFPLSRRQHEVLTNIAQNLSNKEIAAKLNVSVRTIKFHVSSLLEKFDVRGRVDLMLEASVFLPVENVHKRATVPEDVAITSLRPLPLLPSATAKLRLAASVGRSAGYQVPFDNGSRGSA